MSALFEISNLKCGYGDGKTVLEVEALSLPKAKLIFIIGVSGGGKSTLLESLALMNKTIQKGSKVVFSSNDQTTQLDSIWESPEQLDAFRKKHFSFIFQKTNLMPNFTCGENMVLPALFKGMSFNVAEITVKKYMKQLGLDLDLFDKHISRLSGGQQQRLAFIRAMVADFSVLFGDEPTGNLDYKTARDVMSVLKDFLQDHDKTGIVVSHDISLAEDFADLIVPITLTGDKNRQKGIIDLNNIFSRSENGTWLFQGQECGEPNRQIKKLINPPLHD